MPCRRFSNIEFGLCPWSGLCPCVTHRRSPSSHRLQSSSSPRCEARPASVRTQGRGVGGGSCRTCCRDPHAKIARQCCSSSCSKPVIFCFIDGFAKQFFHSHRALAGASYEVLMENRFNGFPTSCYGNH